MSKLNNVYAEMIKNVTKEDSEVANNSVETILSRINSVSGTMEILKGAGIKIHEDASTTLENLASKWTGLSEQDKQDISASVAGRYQMSRMMILMEEMSK